MGRGGKMHPGASYGAVSDISGTVAGSLPDPVLYEAFLTACRPVSGRALDWLTKEQGGRAGSGHRPGSSLLWSRIL